MKSVPNFFVASSWFRNQLPEHSSEPPSSSFEWDRYFDIIGFDPRGINNSRPVLNCLSNRLEAAASTIEENAHGMIGTSDTSFDYVWASKRAMAEGCSKRGAEEGIAKHMATASVARDIVEIVERHGEWRANEANRLVKLDTTLSGDEQEMIEGRTAYVPGSEMVQYCVLRRTW
ncbi:hypothetical protein BTJ68_14891 [Hortaea werneckii EXF-2000]|uniref:Uncharacterized protein n=1 Tax=Hortaea werneckii EXF-2000 TaxID=1157616 RepID=A0A1Z5SRI5_HORWE|nr:hypothetical protein BTJ68_14891 [Hortaea werneckii EXF-2000]